MKFHVSALVLATAISAIPVPEGQQFSVASTLLSGFNAVAQSTLEHLSATKEKEASTKGAEEADGDDDEFDDDEEEAGDAPDRENGISAKKLAKSVFFDVLTKEGKSDKGSSDLKDNEEISAEKLAKSVFIDVLAKESKFKGDIEDNEEAITSLVGKGFGWLRRKMFT
ncbi:MAG: hypothetical protein SGCHY_000421 [Lobulomycetales sp.]